MKSGLSRVSTDRQFAFRASAHPVGLPCGPVLLRGPFTAGCRSCARRRSEPSSAERAIAGSPPRPRRPIVDFAAVGAAMRAQDAAPKYPSCKTRPEALERFLAPSANEQQHHGWPAIHLGPSAVVDWYNLESTRIYSLTVSLTNSDKKILSGRHLTLSYFSCGDRAYLLSASTGNAIVVMSVNEFNASIKMLIMAGCGSVSVLVECSNSMGKEGWGGRRCLAAPLS